jgi:hypothetical protein
MSSDLVLRILYCYQMYFLFYNYCRVCTISNSFFVKCIYFISPNLLHKTIMLFNNQTVFYVRNCFYIYYNVMIVPIVDWLIMKISLHLLPNVEKNTQLSTFMLFFFTQQSVKNTFYPKPHRCCNGKRAWHKCDRSWVHKCD